MLLESLLCAGAFKLVEMFRTPPKAPVAPPSVPASPRPRYTMMRGGHTPGKTIEEVDAEQERLFKVSTFNLWVAALATANPLLLPVVAGGVLYSSFPVYVKSLKDLVTEGKVGNDLLVTLSTAVLGATGNVPALAMGTWFYFLGNKVQRRTRAQAQAKLQELFMRSPEKVWVVRDGVEVETALGQLNKGDIIVVRAGQVISTDGIVVEGQALVDQHLLTGESQPAEKTVGDPVLASTVVLAGRLQVRADQVGAATTIARITAMLEDAIDHKSAHQLKGEQWADQAALPLVVVAGAAAVLVSPMSSGVVLSSGVGNRIRLLGPLGTLSYLHLASHHGFLVKDGRALERLLAVDTVLFDKTGTLTKNEQRVRRVVPMGSATVDDVVRAAAIAESRQQHPIARTILKHAEDLGVEVPTVDDFNYQIGYGISVTHDGQRIQVGSARFLEREGVALDEIQAVQREAEGQGHTLVLVAIDGVVRGAIELEAALREDLATMLKSLRKHGVKYAAIVSGDLEQPTRKLAESLQFEEYYAGVLPDRKAEVVERLQKEGRVVCFIGDGVNDSVAMKKADVSMSLLGASSFAMDAAQIILMDADLGLANLGALFELARKLDSNLRNSLYISLASSVINIDGALFIEDYDIYSAYAVKQVGLAAGLVNALSPMSKRAPKIEAFAEMVKVPAVAPAATPKPQADADSPVVAPAVVSVG